jgi:hypothetical protein
MNERYTYLTPEDVSRSTKKELVDRYLKGIPLLLGGAALVATGIVLALEGRGDNDLPKPKHTGNIVRLHFDDGEGEVQIVGDLHAPGFDDGELTRKVKSIEEKGSSVPSTVLDVDSGLLNQDPAAEKVLLQYGVTQEDLHPQQQQQ